MIWELVESQHGVIAHRQLRALGLSEKAIKHRVSTGRLRPLWRGVYAVGRLGLADFGRWMAAVLACGPEALLSHDSAAALWGIRPARRLRIEVSVPRHRAPRHPGIAVHRRSNLRPEEAAARRRIPVTTPACTLVDIAPGLTSRELEAAVNEADKLDLIHPDELRADLDSMPRRAGIARVRHLVDRGAFVLTDSELERRFAKLARRAGLPTPQTQRNVNGFRVDFYWPDLGLVVETDGLRYHRTPAQQSRDRVRDQIHTAAGLTVLRFTHAQVHFDPAYVVEILGATAESLRTGSARGRAGA